MLIYIANILLILVYWILFKLITDKTINAKPFFLEKIKFFFISLITFQLILILAVRDMTIGVDVQGYIYSFQFLSDYNNFNDNRFEIGYKYLNYLISLFTKNEQIFLSILAVIYILPIGRFIFKHSKIPFLSFLLYISFNYYSFTFSGLRQSLAYGLIFISYDYITERKFIKFLIIILLASTFHKSALIFLPAYFLAKLKINKYTINTLIVTTIMIFAFRFEIFKFLINNFYSSYEIVESESVSWMVLCSVILIIGLFFYKDVVENTSAGGSIYIFMITGVIIMIFASVGTNVMRVADYYYMFVIIFIPEVLAAIKKEKNMLLAGYLTIIFSLALYFKFLIDDGFRIIPYKFFWEL